MLQILGPDDALRGDAERALLLGADGTVDETGLLTKDALAGLVLDRVIGLLDQRRGDPST